MEKDMKYPWDNKIEFKKMIPFDINLENEEYLRLKKEI